MKSGLRLRPTFEGIVDYIANGQETVKYPDRLAKFMRNHPYLTQLDGEGVMEMQEQQENVWKEQEKEHRVKELSTKGTQSAPEVRTQIRSQRGTASSTQTFDLRQQDMDMSEMMDVTEEEIRKRQADARERAERKRQNIIQVIARHNGSDPGVVPFAAAAAAASRSRTPVKQEMKQEMKPEMKQETNYERSRSPPVKKEEKKIDTKGNIKLEGVVPPKMTAASASPARATAPVSRGRGKKRAVSSESDVQEGEFIPNRTRDMTFWEQQSTNEIRYQLTRRYPTKRREYAFLKRKEMLEYLAAKIAGPDW